MTGLNPSDVEVGLKDKMVSGVLSEGHKQSGRVEEWRDIDPDSELKTNKH